jgi:hypothetical protein
MNKRCIHFITDAAEAAATALPGEIRKNLSGFESSR